VLELERGNKKTTRFLQNDGVRIREGEQENHRVLAE